MTTGVRSGSQWLEAFTAGWAAPTDPDSFCDHFDPLLSDQIRLVQPQLGDLVGKRQFREDFARPLFALLDGITGTVESSALREDAGCELLFAELTIRGRLRGRPIELRTIDRITIRDGLAVERSAVLDPTPLLAALALTPRAWPAFARIQLKRLRRRRDDEGAR
jgi:hypothetical protein